MKSAKKLKQLDPKPEELILSRLKILYWRAEPVFVAKNWDDLRLGVKS